MGYIYIIIPLIDNFGIGYYLFCLNLLTDSLTDLELVFSIESQSTFQT